MAFQCASGNNCSGNGEKHRLATNWEELRFGMKFPLHFARLLCWFIQQTVVYSDSMYFNVVVGSFLWHPRAFPSKALTKQTPMNCGEVSSSSDGMRSTWFFAYLFIQRLLCVRGTCVNKLTTRRMVGVMNEYKTRTPVGCKSIGRRYLSTGEMGKEIKY